MNHGTELNASSSHNADIDGVCMDDGIDIGPGFVNRSMNNPLRIRGKIRLGDHFPVQRNFENIYRRNPIRGKSPRNEKSIRVLRIPRTYVPQVVDTSFFYEDIGVRGLYIPPFSRQ